MECFVRHCFSLLKVASAALVEIKSIKGMFIDRSHNDSVFEVFYLGQIEIPPMSIFYNICFTCRPGYCFQVTVTIASQFEECQI
jgi:hypothetical protein